MLLFGDNTKYGVERVELSAERYVDPVVAEGDPFPLGVAGLVPVVTSRRKKGGFKTVYALPFGEGELVFDRRGAEGEPDVPAGVEADALPEDAANQDAVEPCDDDAAAGDGAPAPRDESETPGNGDLPVDPADPVNPADPAGPADPADQLAFELSEVIDFVNLLLCEAADLSGYPFGKIGSIWIGIPGKGYAFTRVEEAASDDLGNPGVAPIHLRIETSDRACDPGSVSAIVEYDRLGYPLHVMITEFDEGGMTRRIMSSVDFDEHDILVQKVVEDGPGYDEPLVLYWRHPPFWFGDENYDGDPNAFDAGARDDRW